MRFLNCQIDVSKKVFQPRTETKYWVKKALSDKSFKCKKLDVLDVFAGTGCIGIAVLENIKDCHVDFADVSREAIEQIKINLRINKISKQRYKIHLSNIFEKVGDKKYDIIFANPPYIAKARIFEVQKRVLENEPHQALFADKDGLSFIRRFLRQVKKYLKKDGVFFLEFDPRQKLKIKKILKAQGFSYQLEKDQFARYRWLKAYHKATSPLFRDREKEGIENPGIKGF